MKGFVVDISKCNGCHNCQLVCKDEHCGNDWLPTTIAQPMTGHFWCRLDQEERGAVPWVRVVYTPHICAHCADAPCVKAAPEAVYRRDDGLIVIDPQKAKGNKDIVDSCPFGAIYWNEEHELAQKCTGCAHLLDDGWEVPRCVDACPTEALRFVELSEVADEIACAETPVELEGCNPHIFYLNVPKNRIAGSLIDRQKNEVLIGATARLIDADGNAHEVTTDDFGDFVFEDMPNGSYEITFIAQGYKDETRRLVAKGKDVAVGDVFMVVKE